LPKESGNHQAADRGTLGGWLRVQRLAQGWSIAEMGRQLCTAAKQTDDYTIASAAIMASYVRRWEGGKFVPTERYQLRYCTVLGLPPTSSASRPRRAPPLTAVPRPVRPPCLTMTAPAW
jgi:hypothetical protein